jgi:hypothetical protein
MQFILDCRKKIQPQYHAVEHLRCVRLRRFGLIVLCKIVKERKLLQLVNLNLFTTVYLTLLYTPSGLSQTGRSVASPRRVGESKGCTVRLLICENFPSPPIYPPFWKSYKSGREEKRDLYPFIGYAPGPNLNAVHDLQGI